MKSKWKYFDLLLISKNTSCLSNIYPFAKKMVPYIKNYQRYTSYEVPNWFYVIDFKLFRYKKPVVFYKYSVMQRCNV